MAGKKIDGPLAVESLHEALPTARELSEPSFDRVDYECPCPNCGALVRGFRTRDLCNQLDTVDYRIAHHFYAECECGAWIDFIRRAAGGIDDFDMYVDPT
jgi:hypothetical protein